MALVDLYRLIAVMELFLDMVPSYAPDNDRKCLIGSFIYSLSLCTATAPAVHVRATVETELSYRNDT